MGDEKTVPEYPEYILRIRISRSRVLRTLFPVFRGDEADLTCNECGTVVGVVCPEDVRRTQDEMQLSLDVAPEQCPHCGAVNLFPGFATMMAYTCRQCGEAVSA